MTQKKIILGEEPESKNKSYLITALVVLFLLIILSLIIILIVYFLIK